MKTIRRGLLLIAGALVLPSAIAVPDIPLSGQLRWVNPTGGDPGYGTAHGGEFYIDVRYLGTGEYDFLSFCLENSTTVSYPTTGWYAYSINADQAAIDGDGGAVGGKDVLSKATAWLFAEFSRGTLSTTTGGAYDNSEENALQQAIWWLENETGGVKNYFVTAAVDALGLGALDNTQLRALNATYGEFGTYVLNTGSAPNYGGQDILYWSVPDGGTTVGLLGLGLVFFGWVRRRMG